MEYKFYTDTEFSEKSNLKPGNVRLFRSFLREKGLIKSREKLTNEHLELISNIKQLKSEINSTWEFAINKCIDEFYEINSNSDLKEIKEMMKLMLNKMEKLENRMEKIEQHLNIF